MKFEQIQKAVAVIVLLASTSVLASISSVGGYGNNIPMSLAVESLIPLDWQIKTTKEVLSSKVSWVGDETWDIVINEIAKDNNFVVKFNYKEKVVEIKSERNYSVNVVPVIKKPTTRVVETPKVIDLNFEKRVNTTTKKKDNNAGLAKKFMDSVGEIFKSPTPVYKKTSSDIKAENLFERLSIPATEVRASVVHKARDNTVRINLNFEINGEPENTYIIFNGVSMYSPYMPKEMSLTVLDWYSSNFIHPMPVVLTPMKPLSVKFKGDYRKEIKATIQEEIKLIDEPEYTKKKEFLAPKGKMISKIISEWGESLGVKVIWHATSDYKIKREILFYDGYLQSVDTLIKFYNNTTKPIQTRFFIKNKTLLVEDLQVLYRLREK